MDANITLMLDPALLQPTEAFIPLLWPIGAIIAALIAWVLKKLFDTEPNGEMRRVLILGTAGSGKTTLWGHLRGDREGAVSKTTIGDKIGTFEFAKNAKGEPIYIEKTEDVAGMEEFVRHWKSKIQDDSFLLFVFDVRELDAESKVKAIKTRLRVIAEVIKEKGFKNIGMYWVGTHLDMTSQSEDHYRKLLMSKLDINKDKYDRILIGDLSKPDGSLYRSIYKVIKDGLCE